MTRKPTINQRFAGFFGLAALASAHVRPVRLALDEMAGRSSVATALDPFLCVWGTVVVLAICGLAVFAALGLAWAAVQWVAWAVTDGGIARPGDGEERAAIEEDEDWRTLEERE